MRDRAFGTRILRRLNRQRFLHRSAVLVTREQIESADPPIPLGVTRRAWYRSKRPGDRAHRIEVRLPTGQTIPLFRVLDGGTWKPMGSRRRG